MLNYKTWGMSRLEANVWEGIRRARSRRSEHGMPLEMVNVTLTISIMEILRQHKPHVKPLHKLHSFDIQQLARLADNIRHCVQVHPEEKPLINITEENWKSSEFRQWAQSARSLRKIRRLINEHKDLLEAQAQARLPATIPQRRRR